MKKRKKRILNKKKIIFVIVLVIVIIFIIKKINSKGKNQDININSSETINESLQNEKEEVTFTMLSTGDIMCHNTMYWDAYNSSTKTYSFDYMFKDIKSYIEDADIAVGNLETTFAGEERGYSSYPTFNTPESLATTLKNVGFDVLSTANNHCYDKGYSGIESTIKYLDEAGISHTGTFTSEESQKDILIKEVKGVKIAFLSFTYGTNGITVPESKSYSVNIISDDLIIEQLNLAKQCNPDLICVSMHWGIEYQTKANDEQQRLAELLIKNGANIILGNHPHVLQQIERKKVTLDNNTEKEGLVIYSQGNLMADQSKQYTRDTSIDKLTITRKSDGSISVDNIEYTPVYIYNSKAGKTGNFKLLDINSEIEKYNNNSSNSCSQTVYSTLTKEVENIKKIIGNDF